MIHNLFKNMHGFRTAATESEMSALRAPGFPPKRISQVWNSVITQPVF